MAAIQRILTRGLQTSTRRLAGAAHENHEAGTQLWKRLSILVALPAVGLCMANAYLSHHEHARPEFVAYEHLRLRTKKFPWGDGNHSLFHNGHVNALPDGYEDDH